MTRPPSALDAVPIADRCPAQPIRPVVLDQSLPVASSGRAPPARPGPASVPLASAKGHVELGQVVVRRCPLNLWETHPVNSVAAAEEQHLQVGQVVQQLEGNRST